MQRLRGLLALGLGLLALEPVTARAELGACVSNANELSQQFTIAQASNQDVVLRIVQGVYDLEGTSLVSLTPLSPQSVRLLGGYTAGCATRTVNPYNTFLLSNAAPWIQWQSRGRRIEIEGIRFGGRGTKLELAPARGSERDFTVALRRNVFEQAGGPQSSPPDARVGIRFDEHRGAVRQVRVENNVFVRNTNYVQLLIEASDGLTSPAAVDASVVNNTLRGFFGTIGLCTLILAPPLIANNIVVDHAFDLDDRCFPFAGSAPTRLINNYFQTRRLAAPLVEQATLDDGVLFMSPLDGIPTSSSTSLNSGSAASIIALPSTDIVGNVRYQGLAPDRGAYESANTGTFVQTVNSVNDAGAGSLRQAIINANATPGLNVIFFDIPGSCPRTINLASALPTISESVRIDGFTQPGSARNTDPDADDATRCVIVRPTSPGTIARGLYSQSLIGSGVQLGVDGLAMGGFSTSAIEVVGGGAHYVQGSQFGGTVGGASLPANATSIVLGASDGGRIGGPEESQRNVIGGATVAGVAVELAFDNSIVNNLIGVAPDGTSALPNAIGIRLNAASRNRITDNVVSGNANGIVLLSPSGFSSRDNLIGANRVGLRAVPLLGPNGSALGNTFNGILVYGDANVVGECVHSVEGQSVVGAISNIVAYNGTTTASSGINVRGGRGNCIAGNRVFANNSGTTAQQVDTGALGIDPVDNDSGPGTDALSNRGINAPETLAAAGSATQGSVRLRLQSRNGIYRVLVYSGSGCSATTAQGDARDLHAVTNTSIVDATASVDGVVEFDVPVGRVGSQGTLVGRGFVAQVQRSPNPVAEPTDASELGGCAIYLGDGSLFADGFE